MLKFGPGDQNVQWRAGKTIDLTWKLDTGWGEAGNGNFPFPLYIFSFSAWAAIFIFLTVLISWFLFCVERACFSFLVLRGVVSSFLDFVWGVTYCSIEGLVSRVFAGSLYEYFVTWWVFFCFFLELVLELLCLDLLSCCVRARFFRWWDGLADLLQSGLLLRTAGSVSLPECRHVGAQGL